MMKELKKVKEQYFPESRSIKRIVEQDNPDTLTLGQIISLWKGKPIKEANNKKYKKREKARAGLYDILIQAIKKEELIPEMPENPFMKWATKPGVNKTRNNEFYVDNRLKNLKLDENVLVTNSAV